MTRTRWTALALAALAAAVYANAAGNGFALDDEFIIVNNERVHGIDRIPQALTKPYWPRAPGRIGLFRPLTVSTFAVEWELWGHDPRPFHLTNIALHALVTVLVFALLMGVLREGDGPDPAARSDPARQDPATRRRPTTLAAAAGAAVFAVHPVHTEAVANTVGRAEVLATAFVLAAAVLYVRGDLSRTRRRLWGGAAVIAVAYLLGLASKEIAVTLPALLLVLEAGRGWRGGSVGGAAPGASGSGGGFRDWAGGFGGFGGVREYAGRVLARWPVYAAAGVALLGYLGARRAVLGTALGNDAAPFFQPLTGFERLLTAVSVWPEYLRLLLFPAELVADYSPGVLMPVGAVGPEVVAGVLVGALAVLVVVGAWARARPVALGVVFFVVAVLPVSNLVVPIGVLLAERTLYLPSVGLALGVAGAWRWVTSERPAWRPVAGGVLALAVVLGGLRTWVRNPTWRSTDAVMATLAADHPESFRVQWMLAGELQARGRTAEALERYRRAADLLPGHYQLRLQYARALLDAGRVDEAIAGFRAARHAVPELPEAHVFLMVALLRDRRPADAVDAGRRALERHPRHRGVYHQLAIALARSGDYAEARRARRQSIDLGGPRASWLQILHEAELLLRLGRPDSAGLALDAARRRAPDPDAVPSLETLSRAIETADSAVLPYP